MTGSGVALSVKQPWAALLAAGLKSVEVRTWPTARRGTVFLHAAKVPDPRPHGWTFVTTPELTADAARGGGIVAVAELVDCVTYPAAAAFAADAHRHRNHPSWFRPPALYGFVFADVRPVRFHRVPGKTFFFLVSLPTPGAVASPPTPILPSADRGVQSAESEDPADTPRSTPHAPHWITPALPTPAGPVIIIDPPEGKEACHHDHRHDTRPPG